MTDRSPRGRGRRLYDWAGIHHRVYETVSGLVAPSRDRALTQLDLAVGDTVLDLGCGPGVNFPTLAAAVGPSGTVVGLDYSSEMARQAGKRTREHDWSNVHVIQGDAASTCFAQSTFDAACATLVLSAVPEPRRATTNVYEALRAGGRFAVLDRRLPFQEGSSQLLNPLLARMMAYTTNADLEYDVLRDLRTVFETVDVVETFSAGVYLAVAVKSPTAVE